MSKNIVKLLGIVTLIVDLPEYDLYRGQVGTVVEFLDCDLLLGQSRGARVLNP